MDISEVVLSLQMTSGEQRAWVAGAQGSYAGQPDGTALQSTAARPQVTCRLENGSELQRDSTSLQTQLCSRQRGRGHGPSSLVGAEWRGGGSRQGWNGAV